MRAGDTGRADPSRISPTARWVAYCRSFSDIPYAKEAADAVGGEDVAKQLYCEDFDSAVRHAGPFMEARYKCFNRFTVQHKNVLELAVGTSVQRGLEISDDQGKIYVGTDLKDMIEEARKLCSNFDGVDRPNHYLLIANVISYDEVIAACRHFGSRRDLLIISEGLWGYLMPDEQSIAAENIRKILEHYGGRWVIPDILDAESLDRYVSAAGIGRASSRTIRRLAELTGREVEGNFHKSVDDASRFFRKMGFEIRKFPMVDNMGSISSIGRLWGEQERNMYEPVLREQQLSVMFLK